MAAEHNPQVGDPVGPSDADHKETGSVTFEELIATPLSEEEARIRLAECDIQFAQCQKERAVIAQREADLTWVRSVIMRQVLNRPSAEAANG